MQSLPRHGERSGTDVDPLSGSLSAPQSLTRYAYVLNDPVNLTDPLGLESSGGPGPQAGCFVGFFVEMGLSIEEEERRFEFVRLLNLPVSACLSTDGLLFEIASEDVGGSPQQAPAQDTELQKQQGCAEVLVDALLKRDKLAPFVVGTPRVEVKRTSKNDFRVSVGIQFDRPVEKALKAAGTFVELPFIKNNYRGNVGRLQPALEIVPDPFDETMTDFSQSDVDFITPAGDLVSLFGHLFRDVLKFGSVTPCNALKRLKV